MNRETWLQERRKGIGSSQAAAICGLSPWSSPLEAFLGYATMDDREPTEIMEIGLAMEPVLAKLYEQRTGEALQKPEPILWSSEHPFMLASLDFQRASDRRIVETKTSRTGHGFGEPGTDEVPQHYAIQVQHQMAVAGREDADLAVLVGGAEFRIYHLRRDDSLIASLVKIEGDFWELVKAGTPPPFDWEHADTPTLVRRLYRKVRAGELVELDNDADTYAEIMDAAAAEAARYSAAKEHAKARLMVMVGENEVAVTPAGRRITRKQVKRKAYSVDSTEYVDFRVSKPGKVQPCLTQSPQSQLALPS